MQELRVRASSGTYKLTFGAAGTPDLPFDADGKEVEDALNALSTIGGAGGSVSVEEALGASDGTTPYIAVITFKDSLGASNVAQIEATDGTTPLSGGVPATSLEGRTRADGTAGGTGLESCTSESGCKAGAAGGGAGQLGNVFDLAVDLGGNLYARDADSNRIQKFSPAGRFIWMIGGNVNKAGVSEAEDLCGAAIESECQAGSAGKGKGQFEAAGLGLAIGVGGPSSSATKNGSRSSTPPVNTSVTCPTPTGCWWATRRGGWRPTRRARGST